VGLANRTIRFTQGPQGTIAQRVDYPVQPRTRGRSRTLVDRCQKLIDASRRYQAESVRKRLAQLYPPTGEPLALPGDLRQAGNAAGAAATRTTGSSTTGATSRRADRHRGGNCASQGTRPSFAGRRARGWSRKSSSPAGLCDGPFPGLHDADRFRYWYITRLISSGELLDAQAAVWRRRRAAGARGEAASASALLGALGSVSGLRSHEGERSESPGQIPPRQMGRPLLQTRAAPPPGAVTTAILFKLLDTLAADPEANLTYVIVPMDRNRDSALVKTLHISGEPRSALLPGGISATSTGRPSRRFRRGDLSLWVQGRPAPHGACACWKRSGVDTVQVGLN
jgi:hypothetical protein